MKKINLVLALSVAVGLIACHNTPATTNKVVSQSHIQGVYKGTLPCADCSGIETTVTLNNDKTYEKLEKYLGKDNANFQEKGTFAFTNDKKQIILTDSSQTKTYYAIDKNQIILLGNDGKPSSLPMADQYRLSKVQ
ncbi:MAG: copper resistance protein NlpE N-terminal domain-containing protein [Gammaproteobacteria bacterium]|nr:copper resistance protein NlpE N-terminal domain-containing protein [Gammaproteobacteria bacterium]MBS9781876.1 copper resistance protein NlpE N-terminal domain-containing protein [Gammaproteobacteria bacterium]